ncbi:helix-turn-helix domain-containing protein [Patescibacteria group bacterium]|nr:helix-turn-helix domain-containing protein [Patescibacteria group bacterium]MCL5091434.1 helix-turn-helix domain-containing protein [Patescibacteria group bacterium]
MCNIDRTYLSQIELGQANPTVKVLHKITRQLHINLQMLFSGV